jgi:hypothetical protein
MAPKIPKGVKGRKDAAAKPKGAGDDAHSDKPVTLETPQHQHVPVCCCCVDPEGGLRTLWIIAGIHIMLAAAYAGYLKLVPYTPPEITPLKAALMKDLQEWDKAYKSNMLWGSYRSGLYFGMRTR